MSELKNCAFNRQNLRRQLLVTASSLALLIVWGIDEAEAANQDTDHPIIWVELGGQFQRLEDSQQPFSPSFMPSVTQANLLSALNVQQPPIYAIDGESKITFQPEDSDWVFAASVQYGRVSGSRHLHQQTANKTVPVSFNLPPPNSNYHVGPKYYYPYAHVRFADGQSHFSEIHGILDFQAGKDVGLGIFGGKGSSVLSGGVRIAQFTSKTDTTLRALPDLHYPTAPITSLGKALSWLNYHPRFHAYSGVLSAEHSFHGIGPSLTWNASAPFVGDAANGELSFDWGINAAVLFGRQTVRGRHKTSIHSYYASSGWQLKQQQGKLKPGFFGNRVQNTCDGGTLITGQWGPNVCKTDTSDFHRQRFATVPNIGGFAGFTFRISDARVSLGYRADLFFGAMDGGIDTHKSENVGLYGPFATISIGIP